MSIFGFNIRNKMLWLWLPILGVFAQIIVELFVPAGMKADFHSESGPHEILQALLTFCAAILALKIMMMPQVRERIWIFLWVMIAFLGCVYITGEEISWGQHILKWNTPEYWSEMNDQGETNFHNTSSWLDQKPRLVLEIGILIGGIIIPMLKYFNVNLPRHFSLIYPDSRVFVTSIIALGINIADKIDDEMKAVEILHRASEVEEVYLFYFVLLYLLYFRQKMASQL